MCYPWMSEHLEELEVDEEVPQARGVLGLVAGGEARQVHEVVEADEVVVNLPYDVQEGLQKLEEPMVHH